MSWKCSCGLINSGLNQNCAASLTYAGEHIQVSPNEPDWLMAVIAAREAGMTENEELYAQFFQKGRAMVKDMDLTGMREHREQLQRIIFEGKAVLAGVDESIREKKAEGGPKVKEWTVSPTTDVCTFDASNAVKIRKDRMSKMDRLQEQLRKAGIDEETVKEMVKNMERKATENQLKTVTFNKPTTEIAAVVVKTDKPAEPDGDKKPFDPSKLVFKPKDEEKK